MGSGSTALPHHDASALAHAGAPRYDAADAAAHVHGAQA